MAHSIRGRLIPVFIGLAVVPLLAAGIILARLTYISMQTQTLTGASALANTIVIVTLILAVATAGISGGLGFLFARRVVQPIQMLTEAAGAIGSGDLASRALIPSDDEIGILTGTFNSTARQIRERIGVLERRVADQTKALAAFGEISRLSALLDEKRLAAEVVDKVKKTFNYHHARIFFYDETGENLILAGGTGETGRNVSADGITIPRAQDPVGRAAALNTPVLISDTAQDPGWQPNPLMPKTRSEIAVPIAAGGQVLGVLDVQQNIANGLTQADADLLQPIADQVAAAVRHARSRPRIRQPGDPEGRIASIQRKIRETKTAEDALQLAAHELGRALGSRKISVVLSASPQAGRADGESPSGGGK